MSRFKPPIEIALACYIPDDGELERERQRRNEADRKRAAAPPRNTLPSTPSALLAECEKHRRRIVDAMREGQPRFYPGTDANAIALLKDKINGFLLPPFGRLFDAAVALDLGDVPAFSGEPQTGRDAVAVLDALIAWCRAKEGPASPAGVEPAAGQPAVKNKNKGGRKRLKDSSDVRDRMKANLYTQICQKRERGQRYADLVQRLKQDKDVVDLAKRAELPIDSTTVRNALECARQRINRSKDRPPDNCT